MTPSRHAISALRVSACAVQNICSLKETVSRSVREICKSRLKTLEESDNDYLCGILNKMAKNLLLLRVFTHKEEWQKGRRQLYKCHDCGRQFVGGKRLDTQDIIKDYVEGKQTLAQLAEKYGVNKSTIWRRIGCMRHIRVISRYKDVVINMDTTYWGRGFGLMVIKDAFRNKILWYKFVGE